MVAKKRRTVPEGDQSHVILGGKVWWVVVWCGVVWCGVVLSCGAVLGFRLSAKKQKNKKTEMNLSLCVFGGTVFGVFSGVFSAVLWSDLRPCGIFD